MSFISEKEKEGYNYFLQLASALTIDSQTVSHTENPYCHYDVDFSGGTAEIKVRKTNTRHYASKFIEKEKLTTLLCNKGVSYFIYFVVTGAGIMAIVWNIKELYQKGKIYVSTKKRERWNEARGKFDYDFPFYVNDEDGKYITLSSPYPTFGEKYPKEVTVQENNLRIATKEDIFT